MPLSKSSLHRATRQRGAVLFVALVFLLLLTLLGITASSTSILQERMTGGMRNAHLAAMGTESALRGGEVDLWAAAARSNAPSGGLALPPCAGSGVQPCRYMRTNGIADQRVVKFRSSASWLDTGSDGAKAYTQPLTSLPSGYETGELASQPRYIIEDLGLDTGSNGQGNMSGSILSAVGGPGTSPIVHLYRVTARSQGATSALMRAAETTFGAYSVTNIGSGN